MDVHLIRWRSEMVHRKNHHSLAHSVEQKFCHGSNRSAITCIYDLEVIRAMKTKVNS